MNDPLSFVLKVDDYANYPKKMRMAITEGLRDTAYFMQGRWKHNLDMWRLELYGIARNSIIVEQLAANVFVVKSNGSAPYLKYHEYGAGPAHIPNAHNIYWPSKVKIRQWVIDKGLHWTDSEGREMSVDQMTYLIQRSQHKYGIDPKPAARPAYEDALRMAKKFINNRMVEMSQK